MDDLSVAGPGSPISLKKTLDTIEPKPITILVDGSGCGIAKDADDVIYITDKECFEQSSYYLHNKYKTGKIPAYLFRHLSFFFCDDKDTTNVFAKTDEMLVEYFRLKVITETSPQYIYIKNLIEYCESNKEAGKLIGLIQLVAGIMNIAKKEKKGIKLYLENPETFLHPSRQSKLVSFLIQYVETKNTIKEDPS
jgi:hypothetical protein